MDRRFVRIFLGFWCALTVTGYAWAADKVGVIIPTTGDFARYGEQIRRGLEASKASNVRFLFEDEGCNPKAAVSAFRKLHDFDGVRLFIGPWCGSPQVAIASLLGRSESFAVLGGSAPQRVFELSGGRMLSVQHSIEYESAFNATEAYRLGARRVMILFVENDFSRAHEAAFRAHFPGTVIDTLTYSTPDASSMRALVTKIQQLKPDTLYVPDASPFMHGLTKQLASFGLERVRVMSVYSVQSEDVLRAVGKGGEGLIFSYPKIEGEALDHFPSVAVEVMMFGLQKCGTESIECMQREIRNKYPFDEHGVLRGDVALKHIKGGRFMWITP